MDAADGDGGGGEGRRGPRAENSGHALLEGLIIAKGEAGGDKGGDGED